LKAVVLDFEMISDIDTTASDQFLSLLSVLEQQGVSLYLARLHQPVRQFMSRDGLIDAIGEENIFPRVMDAVASVESSQTP
jgi:MFS superfamily sulfate permease-like transporter